MADTTANLDLPRILPAQAQKHVTHNEALQLLDAVVQLVVQGFDADTPPPTPGEGEVWALGAVPTGAWEGQAGRLAVRAGTGWLFATPRPGWRAWGRAEADLRIWDGVGWGSLFAGRAGLGINTGFDAANRLSVAAPATLLSHEGAGHQLKINKAGAAETAALLFQSGWSGRAEMGLAGNDDFSVKVSADGSSWIAALTLNRTNGHLGGAAVQQSASDITAGRLMRADYGFCRGNILGTVGQAAGVPTGAVIERGTNANGDYVRFADGTQICLREVSTLTTGGAAVTFPASFISAGAYRGSGMARSTTPVVTAVDSKTATQINVSCWDLSGARVSRQVDLMFVGRWF